VATNANSKNARSRMEANSIAKHECGEKKDESSTGCVWVAGFYHVMACSHFVGVLKHMNHLFI
jgi:hypothetical protein